MYGGVSIPLLPVAAGYPTGGQPAHWQTSQHMSGIQHIIYVGWGCVQWRAFSSPTSGCWLSSWVAACSLTNIRTYVRYTGHNICQVKMCTVACLFLSYQWLLVIQLGGSLLIDKHQNIFQVYRTYYMLGEYVYSSVPFPLLPVAAGCPAGGQPAHWQTSAHMSGIQDIIYIWWGSGRWHVFFLSYQWLLVIQLGGSLLINKHQNIFQVYRT